jgi:16S rRNA C967 or C1407 C5-methylase (RsmB/RsmF family)/NOL1/NOP2/fmu family ribosome biogenesis protein
MDLPLKFRERTKALLGDEYADFEQALLQNPPTSIRVNDKIDYKPTTDKVLWCEHGYYLDERPRFTLDPLLHAGVYYVQEASSMFLNRVVSTYFPDAERVLDLCAAPGGKSTLLLQALSDSCLLVSNEIIRSRAHILAENIVKWGNANVVVTNNEAADFSRYRGFFDALVIDAPCSGEGMFRKDPEAVNEWSEANVLMCARRQKEIVAAVWDALKPGGVLVYSTCTYNREENEDNVRWICGEFNAEVLRVKITASEQIVETEAGYRFYPHKVKGEGLFMSVIRKPDDTISIAKKSKIDSRKIKKISQDSVPFKLKNILDWTLINDENYIRAYQSVLYDDMVYIMSGLRVVESGILLAEQKGKDFIPAAQLALSKYLDTNSIDVTELDKEKMLAYLRKDVFIFENNYRGYLLMMYQGSGLGWIKNMGNRFNNLYPNNWRIRMGV